MAVSLPVCEIWRDLEKWVRGRSRLLKMAPFDRPYTTFYWSAIVSIALFCTTIQLFGGEYLGVTLKSGLEVTRSLNVIKTGTVRKLGCSFRFAFHSNWRYLESFARYSNLLVENREIFLPHLYLAPMHGVTPSEFCEMFGIRKTRMNDYRV